MVIQYTCTRTPEFVCLFLSYSILIQITKFKNCELFTRWIFQFVIHIVSTRSAGGLHCMSPRFSPKLLRHRIHIMNICNLQLSLFNQNYEIALGNEGFVGISPYIYIYICRCYYLLLVNMAKKDVPSFCVCESTHQDKLSKT